MPLPSPRLLPGLLSGALIVAFGVSARAESPADRARAVVQVVALGAPDFSARSGALPLATLPAVAGSGVIVSPDCVIVTNHHVVAQAVAVAVRFPGEGRLQAAAVAHLADRDDLAVLIPERARCADFVPPPAAAAPDGGAGPRAPARPPPVGAGVFKIGYGGETDVMALRTRRATVARGVVARLAVVAGTPVMAVYVPVDPGDSGGLLCDEEGRMVGVTRGHHRAREGVGYAVPGWVVAGALQDARASLERARARLVRPAWAHEVVVAETAAEVAAEGRDPEATLRLVRERGAALALVAAGPRELRPEVRLVAAAMVWDLGVARLDERGGGAEGCRLLAAAAALVQKARADEPRLRRSPFEEQLAEIADAPAVRARCAAGTRAPGPVAAAPAARRAGGVPRLVFGERLDLYARWVVTVYRGPGRTGASPGGVEAGLVIPVAERGPVRLGLVLGYAFLALDVHAGTTLHRIEVPVRVGYRALFLEAGVTACVTDFAAPEAPPGWRAGAGFLVRAGGRKKFVEAGAAYADLPVGGGRLRAGEFVLGLVW